MPDSRILDVGYGDGALLNSLSASGYRDPGHRSFVEPTHPHEPAVRTYRRTLDDEPGTYDIVMLHHSLEHMPDPRKSSATYDRCSIATAGHWFACPWRTCGWRTYRELWPPRAAATPRYSERRGHAPAGRARRLLHQIDRVRLVRLLLRRRRDLGFWPVGSVPATPVAKRTVEMCRPNAWRSSTRWPANAMRQVTAITLPTTSVRA